MLPPSTLVTHIDRSADIVYIIYYNLHIFFKPTVSRVCPFPRLSEKVSRYKLHMPIAIYQTYNYFLKYFYHTRLGT